MTWIGLDFGHRRVGVAIRESGLAVSVAIDAVDVRGNATEIAAQVWEAISGRAPSGLVVGLPLNRDGREGLVAKNTRKFANALAQLSALDVALADERFTTQATSTVMRAAGISERDQRGNKDSAAAVLILDAHLGPSNAR